MSQSTVARTSLRFSRKWRGLNPQIWRGKKPWKVDPAYLSSEEPMSGSVGMKNTELARKFRFDVAAMSAKGFYRFQKPYTPVDGVELKVLAVIKAKVVGLADADEKTIMQYEFKDSEKKFEVLNDLFSELNHPVPNSMLFMMKSIGDIVDFYKTPIDTSNPYEKLLSSEDELPSNLHIQPEPIRFHPDTDTKFDGVSAFPRSSTLVTGIRTKKKYKPFKAQIIFP